MSSSELVRNCCLVCPSVRYRRRPNAGLSVACRWSEQLDYFLTDARLGAKVLDTKRTGKEIGCRSDHAAVKLTVRFGFESSERRTKRKGKKKNIKWSELDDPATEIRYQAKLDELLGTIKGEEGTLNSESLSEAFIKAGKATCEVEQVSSKGWFKMSAESLTEAIEARNLAHAIDVDHSSMPSM